MGKKDFLHLSHVIMEYNIYQHKDRYDPKMKVEGLYWPI